MCADCINDMSTVYDHISFQVFQRGQYDENERHGQRAGL